MKFKLEIIFESSSELYEFSERMKGFGKAKQPMAPEVHAESPNVHEPEPESAEDAEAADTTEVIRCQECREPFEPKRSDSKFCSPKCYQKAYFRAQKLKKIKAECPAPTKRPKIDRSLA